MPEVGQDISLSQAALTCFCCTVNVLDGEDSAQSIEKHFGQSWYKLSSCDQHIHTVRPRKQKSEVAICASLFCSALRGGRKQTFLAN